jgi:DNA-binding transcriptional LysR family regulator
MMRRRLPPLNALRAFEAAARHGGFVAAAEELGVTPAAVSHQVKGLEEHLSLQLFVRHRRAVALTAAGQALLPGLTEALDQMVQAVDRVRRTMSDDRPLVIATSASFAAKWLMPRLPDFLDSHPDCPIRIETEAAASEGGLGDADMAIRCDLGEPAPGAGLDSDRLFADRLFPVCAPILRMAVRTPTNLTTQTLIHDTRAGSPGDGVALPGWLDWLTAAGVPTLVPRAELHFGQATLALDAAVKARGVALGRGALVATELKAGLLVRPFEMAIESPAAYRLLCPGGSALRPAALSFRDWLRREAEHFRETAPQIVA